MGKRRLIILGATGSVGRSALELLTKWTWAHSNYEVVGLVARESLEGLLAWARALPGEYRGDFGLVGQQEAEGSREAERFRAQVSLVRSQSDGAVHRGWAQINAWLSRTEFEVLLVACPGVEALLAVHRALELGKEVWLANKELSVSFYPLLAAAQASGNGKIYPLDSEHQAIFQLLKPHARGESPLNLPFRQLGFARCSLMATGGPFWGWSNSELEHVTPAQACRHPTWSMGPKVSIDSATFMNKALEYIEARYLFGLAAEEIEVVRHPQAYVHASVQDLYGRQTWLVAPASMKFSIAGAMVQARADAPALDEALGSGLRPLPVEKWSVWEFERIALGEHPALRLAHEAFEAGPESCCALEASNTAAVEAFLQGRLAFSDIVEVCERAWASRARERFETPNDALVYHREAVDRAKRILVSVRRPGL